LFGVLMVEVDTRLNLPTYSSPAQSLIWWAEA